MQTVLTKQQIQSGACKPIMPDIEPANIPEPLKNEARWLGWDFEKRNGKWAKVPKDAKTGGPGSSTDVQTWCDFYTAHAAYLHGRFDGIGFVLGDNWVGIDLDDCRNAATGELSQLAQDIVRDLKTYAEVSPSGTGIKLYCQGELPPKHRTKSPDGKIEFYTWGRYFCVTGLRLDAEQSTVEDRQSALTTAWRQYVDEPAKAENKTHTGTSGAGVHFATLEKMLAIQPKDGENDGSKRLLAVCCRAVEANLDDLTAVATVQKYAETYPFPAGWNESDIMLRLLSAEKHAERGSEIIIRVSDDRIGEVIAETEAALQFAGVYQNTSSMLTRCIRPPAVKDKTHFDNGSPRLDLLPKGAMLETLDEAAEFQYFNDKAGWVTRRPDQDLRCAIRERLYYPNVKVARGIVSQPILLPSGEIVTTPGYNRESGLILDIEGEWPEPMDNATALDRLAYVYKDFPFEGESHRAANIAALVTLVARNLIPGNAPFFAVDGNRPGCGKGLLTDTWTLIAEGRRASRFVYTTNQEEMEKRLVALAVSGRPYMIFDNIKDRFGGHVLEAAMTTGSVSGRLLGFSKTIDLPLNILWAGTCNGMTYTPDLMARTVPIMLTSPLVDPRDRQDMTEKNLLAYVAKNRRELLIAVLSLVANYIKAGQPLAAEIPAFGSFEEWSQLVRGVVMFARLPDPCEHRAAFREETENDVAAATKKMIEAWPFQKPIKVRDVITALTENLDDPAYAPLRTLLRRPDDAERSDAEHLGKLLREAKGHVVNGKCFATTGSKNVVKWSLQILQPVNEVTA